jgi:hypothetical protein
MKYEKGIHKKKKKNVLSIISYLAQRCNRFFLPAYKYYNNFSLPFYLIQHVCTLKYMGTIVPSPQK